MKKTIRQIQKNSTTLVALLVVVFQMTFPHYSLAAQPVQAATASIILPNYVIAEDTQKVQLISPIKTYHIVKTYQMTVTAYSSTVDQTDITPCITANGFNLCEHNQEDVIAANFLPFGTKVRMPKLFGDRIFTVQDRMNARYYYQVDIWLKTREAAVKFGAHYITIEVLE